MHTLLDSGSLSHWSTGICKRQVLTDMAERDWLALTVTPQVRQGTKSTLKIKIPSGRMNQEVGKKGVEITSRVA